MRSFTCHIEAFRIGEMESIFNHISIPIGFEIQVGGKWLKGKAFYHHYHRNVSYDSTLSQLLEVAKAEQKEEILQAIILYVAEKTNSGLTLARPPKNEGAII
ncbi:hypothetical protein [Sutcliffiella deserti]|uniref:hypothetical protein n=1 Tax=Sutcliffiella deserti TaxID=2875501 RepID=UPI001CBEE025|nr:hypothetical protein [Sutcliffiella deserti]